MTTAMVVYLSRCCLLLLRVEDPDELGERRLEQRDGLRERRLQAAHEGRLELELRRKPREQLHLFAAHRASAEEPADDLQGLERPRFIDVAFRELDFVAGA